MPEYRLKSDYKTAGDRGRRHYSQRHHYLLGSVLACVLGVVLFNVSSDPVLPASADLNEFAGGTMRSLELPPLEAATMGNQAETDYGIRELELVVKPGDSLAAIFQRNHLSAVDLHNIMQLGSGVTRLRKLHPGDVIQVRTNDSGGILHLMADPAATERLEVIRGADGFQLVETSLPVQRRVRVASNSIQTSLYQAGYDAGLSDALIMNLANIFGWDIDFALDIRKGDQFRIIYEEIFRDGEKLKDGPILAAEFINDGRRLAAVRFEDDDGRVAYYGPDGRAMRKTFLRAPLNFRYVSSGFNPKRLHPVLKQVRPHNGIDYAAPTGTPVYAAGDGKVIRAGYDKYNGHHVFIQHGSSYVTRYLHFTRRTVKTGERVRQGQVIGHVGATGLASGPHLHYEFLVNGSHRNPRTVKLPDAEPIPDHYRERFTSISTPLLRQLELLDPAVRVAVAP